MSDFVVYHNSDLLGSPTIAVKKLTALIGATSKKLEGHRVWLVVGEGKPRRYYLRSYFWVEKMEPASKERFQALVTGTKGKILEPMPILNSEEWFADLKRTQCNFRFGLRPILDQKAILGLEAAAGIRTEPIEGKAETEELEARTRNGSASRKDSGGEISTKARRIVGNAKKRRKKMIAFGWYGGKYSHLDFILPNIPNGETHFCDVFGGSAAVLINRKPAPLETYNDVDSELVNFFEMLRDRSVDLIRAISLTPFSREELVIACTPEDNLDKLERARRFYVRARQTRTGLAQTSSEGRWAHCVLTSRAGMAGAVSRWLGAVENLPEIVQRLQRVQIENAPALEIIERYDSEKTLFYLDPPYVHSSRNDSKAYGNEMSDFDHMQLAQFLSSIKGRAVVSGYRTDLYDELFKDWKRIDAPEKICNSSKGLRQESLWLNC